jgi:predicted HTH transcriptional regulator
MVSANQVDIWRSEVSEHQQLEFKEAKKQIEYTGLCEYCVALANEGGGYLILGVANKPPRPVVGTSAISNPAKTAQQLFNRVGFRVDVHVVSHPQGRLVVFEIPTRPRGTAYHLSGRYLMRSGEALVPMSEDQLRRIFAEGQPNWLEEHSKTSLTSAEVFKLLDTKVYCNLLQLPYPKDSREVLDRLCNDRMIDQEEGRYSIRRIGALLLAERLSDFDELERKAPRVIAYKGTDKLETLMDRTG